MKFSCSPHSASPALQFAAAVFPPSGFRRGAVAVLVAVLAAAVPQARAGLLTEETFGSYAVNSNLDGANGGAGWNGAWAVGNPGQGFANQVRNNVYNFSYPNYTASTSPALSSGNYLNLAAGFSTPNFNYAQRSLDTSVGGGYGLNGYLTVNGAANTVIGADNRTLWGSFLYQGNNGGTQFWLRNPGVADQMFNLPGLSPEGTTGLVLFRINYVSGPDTITFWNNPDLSTWTTSTTPSSTAVGDYSFSQFIFVENGADIEGRLDDVRFGTTARDVAPVLAPEPSAWAAVLIGCGLAAVLRLRRPAREV